MKPVIIITIFMITNNGIIIKSVRNLCQRCDQLRSCVYNNTVTRSLNVTQETTERHLIVRIGKSEADVTNNKRLRSMYCRPTVGANYRARKHRAASLRQQSYLLCQTAGRRREAQCSRLVHSFVRPFIRPSVCPFVAYSRPSVRSSVTKLVNSIF